MATKYSMSRDGTDPNAAGNHRKNLTGRWRPACASAAPTTSNLYWVHLLDRHTHVEETMRALEDAGC